MRPVAVRQLRTTRLSPVQRLTHVAEQVRRWMGEHFESNEVVAEKVSENVMQTGPVKQTQKARRSLSVEPHRQNRQQPRHSRGIGH